ncbi:dimethyl sulfoxide reductase anchor subunit [Ectothiorhodospiraceae bacterium 2226]|nr:dimethyl sulfoxide reductase anchor subunit [Ectothiorhodospiraceae bacterium 2226]
MHPAFSVIFLTTLIGAAQGLFLALFVTQWFATVGLIAPQDSVQFYAMGNVVVLVLLGLGLFASFFHLGRPERAWRSATRWRTSWLSREVIVLPALMGFSFIHGAMHLLGWDAVLWTTAGGVSFTLSLLVGALGALTALALFISTGMIYACIKFLQEWASPLTVVNFTVLGIASGFTLATAFAAAVSPELVHPFGISAIAFTALGLVTRVAALIRNKRLKHKSSLQTAIGVRHTHIQQKAQGAMGGSFNTREFFHGKSDAVVKTVLWTFLLLTFPVPMLLVWIGMTAEAFGVLALAFAVQYLGLVCERWFFFAQANHPQNLYYQTI